MKPFAHQEEIDLFGAKKKNIQSSTITNLFTT
jgi:hypothetical protein